MSYPEFIRSRRLARGLTIATAAAAAGTSWYRWHSLERRLPLHPPTPDSAATIARVLGVTVRDVYHACGVTAEP